MVRNFGSCSLLAQAMLSDGHIIIKWHSLPSVWLFAALIFQHWKSELHKQKWKIAVNKGKEMKWARAPEYDTLRKIYLRWRWKVRNNGNWDGTMQTISL